MKLRVGTRRSRLARTQTGQACRLIERVSRGTVCEEVPIETTGDRVRDRPLKEAGGKGLFVKELDEALLDGRIDCAVHSMKDVPTVLPDGIVIAAVPAREDPRDLLVTRHGWGPRDLPERARLGTTSARRAAQLLAARPGLEVALLRGNVETRLRRLVAGDFDATFLAAAGLRRLGLDPSPARVVPLDPFEFVPAPGQ
ncbi:MAG: hydroxymethylbilane synthase, partial [Candidatus Dadabacteria bacterium]